MMYVSVRYCRMIVIVGILSTKVCIWLILGVLAVIRLLLVYTGRYIDVYIPVCIYYVHDSNTRSIYTTSLVQGSPLSEVLRVQICSESI